MLLRKTSIYCLIAWSLMAGQVFGQKNVPGAPVTGRSEEIRQPSSDFGRWHEEVSRRNNSPALPAQSSTQFQLITRYRFDARKKLIPTNKDKKGFEAFLNQEKTGLFKFPAENNCSKGLDAKKPFDDCLNYFLPGKGFAYSFRKKDYNHNALSDLQISNGKFVISGAYIMGMLTFLGDIPIESVTHPNENVSSLQQFSPAAKIDEIISQDTSFSKGAKVGNLVYRKSAPIQENATYLLRSIAFDAEFENRSLGEPDPFVNDIRTDVIILFRVVKKDKDGSIMLLWKELHRQNSPKITVDLGK